MKICTNSLISTKPPRSRRISVPGPSVDNQYCVDVKLIDKLKCEGNSPKPLELYQTGDVCKNFPGIPDDVKNGAFGPSVAVGSSLENFLLASGYPQACIDLDKQEPIGEQKKDSSGSSVSGSMRKRIEDRGVVYQEESSGRASRAPSSKRRVKTDTE